MKVLIASMSYDFKFHALFIDSLIQTERMCESIGIKADHLFICGDALVQRARNDVFKVAKNADIDKLFMIDSDIFWNPTDFMKLIVSDHDFIGGAYIQKSDNTRFVYKPDETATVEDHELKVQGMGMGFVCLSRETIDLMWESSEVYTDSSGEGRMVFDVRVIGGELNSEDITFCKKWAGIGGEMFIRTDVTLGHIGEKKYIGCLQEFINQNAEEENVNVMR